MQIRVVTHLSSYPDETSESMETQAIDHIGSDEGLPSCQPGSLVCGLCLVKGLALKQVIESWTGSFLGAKFMTKARQAETDQMGSL